MQYNPFSNWIFKNRDGRGVDWNVLLPSPSLCFWFHQICMNGGIDYFDITSTILSMISSLRFFMPNQTTIAIEAPRPRPSPQAIGVIIV